MGESPVHLGHVAVAALTSLPSIDAFASRRLDCGWRWSFLQHEVEAAILGSRLFGRSGKKPEVRVGSRSLVKNRSCLVRVC
jgi:hypothetical protein